MAPSLYEFKRSNSLKSRSHHLTVEMARYNSEYYVNMLLSCITYLRNSLQTSCFLLKIGFQKS